MECNVCLYVCVNVRMYVMYVCMLLSIHPCMYVCMYVCGHACTYVCMYMHTYMYIYIHSIYIYIYLYLHIFIALHNVYLTYIHICIHHTYIHHSGLTEPEHTSIINANRKVCGPEQGTPLEQTSHQKHKMRQASGHHHSELAWRWRSHCIVQRSWREGYTTHLKAGQVALSLYIYIYIYMVRDIVLTGNHHQQ